MGSKVGSKVDPLDPHFVWDLYGKDPGSKVDGNTSRGPHPYRRPLCRPGLPIGTLTIGTLREHTREPRNTGHPTGGRRVASYIADMYTEYFCNRVVRTIRLFLVYSYIRANYRRLTQTYRTTGASIRNLHIMSVSPAQTTSN